MQGKLKLHKHVDFISNWVTIDVLVLIKKPLIGEVDVLHEHLIVLLFSYLLVLTLIILKLQDLKRYQFSENQLLLGKTHILTL